MSLAIEAFVDNVRGYCELFESDNHNIASIRDTLLALMQGVPYVVSDAPGANDNVDIPRRSYQQWKKDVARLDDIPIQYYQSVSDPFQLDNESIVVGDLYDDLADIYGELWHGLQAYDEDYARYALQHWQESYRTHWGCHAVGAITAIDAYLHRNAR